MIIESIKVLEILKVVELIEIIIKLGIMELMWFRFLELETERREVLL